MPRILDTPLYEEEPQLEGPDRATRASLPCYRRFGGSRSTAGFGRGHIPRYPTLISNQTTHEASFVGVREGWGTFSDRGKECICARCLLHQVHETYIFAHLMIRKSRQKENKQQYNHTIMSMMTSVLFPMAGQ